MGAGLLALHALAASRRPVGLFNDDALSLILARSLLHGRFAAASGAPVTDPLPGFPLLLAPAAAILAPHWGIFRWLMVAPCWLLAALTWKVARRFLPAAWALAAAVLVGANSTVIEYAGGVLPDIPFALLALALIDSLSWKESRAKRAFLILGAALACLMRPHGAMLVLSLALALTIQQGAARAATLVAPAFLALGAWTLRNWAAAGTPTRYLVNWRQNMSLGGGAELLSGLVSRGVLGIGLPRQGVVLGALTVALMAVGAREWAKKDRAPAIALAAFVAGTLALHFTWPFTPERYAIPILPAAWILLSAAAYPRLAERGLLAGALAAALILPALGRDLYWLSVSYPQKAELWPRTMAFLREQTPPSARVQTLAAPTVALWTGRATNGPPLAESREQWLQATRGDGASYVLVIPEFVPEGLFTGPMAFVAGHLEDWAVASGLRPVFVSPGEGTRVYQFERQPL